ncbi:MAG: hypothetical protein IT308_01265 [Anaerolineaceae bacterium]|nr:hypothetical protein [Anaerolineaceae bacterium]
MRSFCWPLLFFLTLLTAACTGQVPSSEAITASLTSSKPVSTATLVSTLGVPTEPIRVDSSPVPERSPTPAVEQVSPAITPEPGFITPASPVEATLTNTASGNTCVDTAAYFGDVTIPDGTSFKQNVRFTKTWRIRNEGSCTWGNGYSLVFHSGDILDGPLTNPMPAAAPGDIVEVSVDLKSPPQGGEYTGFWEFQNPDNRRFGVNSNGIDLIWVKIGVSFYTDEGHLPTLAPAVSTPGVAPAGCTADQNLQYNQQLLTLINQARRTAALPELTPQKQLDAAAYAHSADMACNDFVDHVGSDGSTWTTRIKAQNYEYTYASENIYVGNPAFGGDAQGAFNWWMNSQIHRDNILSPKVTEIGISYVYNAASTYGGYATLDFARP